jgi:peptidoglycan/LPS O-acetylase OafA/YrhL
MRGLVVVATGVAVALAAVVAEGYLLARSGGPLNDQAAYQTQRLFTFGVYPALVILLAVWAGRSIGSRRGMAIAVLASAPIAVFVSLSSPESAVMTGMAVAYLGAAAAAALLVSAQTRKPTT